MTKRIAVLFSPEEAATLMELLRRERAQVRNTRQRPRTDLNLDPGIAPEVYLFRAPAGGIPASALGTGTGTDDDANSAECDVYRLSDGAPERVPGMTRTVYNHGSIAVSGHAFFLGVREKWGDWYVANSAGGGSSLTVENPFGTPVITDVSTIEINSNNGKLLLSQQSAGVARLSVSRDIDVFSDGFASNGYASGTEGGITSDGDLYVGINGGGTDQGPDLAVSLNSLNTSILDNTDIRSIKAAANGQLLTLYNIHYNATYNQPTFTLKHRASLTGIPSSSYKAIVTPDGQDLVIPPWGTVLLQYLGSHAWFVIASTAYCPCPGTGTGAADNPDPPLTGTGTGFEGDTGTSSCELTETTCFPGVVVNCLLLAEFTWSLQPETDCGAAEAVTSVGLTRRPQALYDMNWQGSAGAVTVTVFCDRDDDQWYCDVDCGGVSSMTKAADSASSVPFSLLFNFTANELNPCCGAADAADGLTIEVTEQL